MSKRIVIALGGNALGSNQVVVAHGNGPQVGIINNAMAALQKEDPNQGFTPLSVCGAMSQAYIGYDLQNAFREELLDRGIRNMPVCSIVTQVEVDPADPAFADPSKPIGKFMTAEEAADYAARTGYLVKEDAGRGWRRYVASPKPKHIIEAGAIRALTEDGHLVICCGGGGIPVCRTEKNHLKGASAVIDKDFASELLAEQLDADMLIILTAVEKVAINFRKENEQWLSHLTPDEAREYIAQGQFAPGSMLPKVEAAVKFAQSKPGRQALITLLERHRRTHRHHHQPIAFQPAEVGVALCGLRLSLRREISRKKLDFTLKSGSLSCTMMSVDHPLCFGKIF